jgi:hypothetical protein
MPVGTVDLAERSCRAISKGDVLLTKAQKEQLRPYKEDLHTLASSSSTDKAERTVLTNQGFLGTLIAPEP